jgi:hypothetical protein
MSKIRIRRRTANSTAPTAAQLASAELAYNEVTNTLYIGTGTGDPATGVAVIGGSGDEITGIGFVTRNTNQTISGDKTFNGVVGFTSSGSVSFGGSAVFNSTANFYSNVNLGGTADATTQLAANNSNRVATTAFVKNQGYTSNTGTVTSVSGTGTVSGLTLSGTVTTSGNITLSGTLAVTPSNFASQTANTVLAAPNGSAGTPSFRALVAADIPSLTAAKISDFDSQVRLSRLDQMAAPTVDLSLNSRKITNLALPTNDQDAANKAYVDTVRQGLDVKESVRLATTGNITLSGGQNIDGANAVVTGDRILVKNQSTPSQNGIYIANTAGAWTRAADFNTGGTTGANITPGAFTFVEEGTINADTGWVMSTDGTITVGTTNITFVQFSGAGVVTTGSGLTRTGNEISALGTEGRIVIGTGIDLAPNVIGTTGTYTAVTVDTYGRVTNGVVRAVNTNAATGLTGGGSINVDRDIGLTGQALALHQLASNGIIARTGTGTVAARSVTGTANRIAVTNGNGVTSDPTVDIASTYVGQTSITTLGTVATGTWQGTAVAAQYGGTGLATYAVGDLIQATGTTTLARLAAVAAGNVLISGGVGAASSWGKVGLTTHVSGTLPVGNGGTGATSLSGYVYGNGTGAMTASTTIPSTAITGLGTMSTQPANNVTITGGTITGATIDGGTY